MLKKTGLIALILVLVCSCLFVFAACNEEDKTEEASILYYSLDEIKFTEGDEYKTEDANLMMYLSTQKSRVVSMNVVYDDAKAEKLVGEKWEALEGGLDSVLEDGKFKTKNVAEEYAGSRGKYRVPVKFVEESIKDKDGNDIYLVITVAAKK